jgi:hypothetical protein
MIRGDLARGALIVSRTSAEGLYPDGAGLYLQVGASGAKSWVYRFTLHGRAREMGLGSVQSATLAQARRRAEDCRRLRDGGEDPIEARKREIAKAQLEAAKSITFKQAAQAHIDVRKAGWRNTKHAQQWQSTLETHVFPVLGRVSVQDVDTTLVLKVLEPIWGIKTETACRVRGRIEAILDAAKARGQRQGENPARWRSHLDKILAAPSKVRHVKHHLALQFGELPTFFQDLRRREVSLPGL